MSDGTSILLTVGGTALGAGASWLFSWLYYRRSGTDLETALRGVARDNEQLLRATSVLGRMLQQSGIGKPTFDDKGNLTGLVLEATGSGGIGIGGSAIASVTMAMPRQYDRQHEQPPLSDLKAKDA